MGNHGTLPTNRGVVVCHCVDEHDGTRCPCSVMVADIDEDHPLWWVL